MLQAQEVYSVTLWLIFPSQHPSCPPVPVHVQRKTSSSPSGAPPAAPHGVAAVAFWLRCEAPTSIHQETHYPRRDTRIASVALQPDLAAALALEPTLSTLWFYPPFTIALKVPPRRRNQGDPTEGNSDPNPYLWMLPKPQRRSAVLSSSSLLSRDPLSQ